MANIRNATILTLCFRFLGNCFIKSMRFSFFVLLLVLSGFAGTAQPKLKPAKAISAENAAKLHLVEDTLTVLAYAVVNDSIEQERFAACRQLITGLVRALKTENSFKYPFSRLKSLSIMSPPDSSFRIFTWQLFVNDSTYRYYGAIQRNSSELTLFPLIDRSADIDYPMPRYTELTADQWYGALYYNIRQFDTKKGRRYLLMGYDAFEFFEKRKLIDVLYFDKEGKPVFGDTVFDRDTLLPGGVEMRIMMQYTAEAPAKCNYDEYYQKVLIEHLIPAGSPFGRGITMVPDGSYDALELQKNGHWKYIVKVFNDVMDEAPGDGLPNVQNKQKDIFGKPKKKAPTAKSKKEKP